MHAFTPDDVARIVRAVLDRVREPAAPPQVPASSPPVAAPAAAAYAVPDKVVTAAALAGVPTGTRTVAVRADAVVTPSARDRARDGGFAIERTAARRGPSPTPAPLLVGSAECPGDVSGTASGAARAVPGATRLPATGLADVVAALALHVTRDGGRGLLLAGRPHLAVALSNRSPGVRAVWARDTSSLLAAVAECAANVVVVHPRDFSAASLARVATALSASAPVPPPELAAGCPCGGPAKSACSCSGH